MIDFEGLVLPEDQVEAKKLFNSLPIEKQLGLVLHAQGRERLNYIFLSEKPKHLVEQLPELEIFITIKEIGEKDALDLISLTTSEQFQFILDLDLWEKDRLDERKVLKWMEILLESGEEKIDQFIHSTDIESLALILKKFLHVTTFDGEPLEIRDRLPLFTLDQHYFIEFKARGAREVFCPFLERLLFLDEEGYRRLMDSLIWELESELEETNYRLRNSRLADYGFPEFEEALEIYRFINPDSLTIEGGIKKINGYGEVERGGPIFYLSLEGKDKSLNER